MKIKYCFLVPAFAFLLLAAKAQITDAVFRVVGYYSL